MNSITLIKQHPCIQLAHLYEHLFINQVNPHLFDLGLFKGLDYDLNGSTYEQGGVIAIELTTYTQEAKELPSMIQDIKLEFDDVNLHISKAFLQISAERNNRLFVTDPELVVTELQALNKTTWQNLDSILLNTRRIKTESNPIYTTDEPQSRGDDASITIHPSSELIDYSSELLPLFHDWSKMLLVTISTLLASRYGLYSSSIQGGRPQFTLISHLHSSVDMPTSIDTTALINEVKYIISTITTNLTMTRFLDSSRDLEVDFSNALITTGMLQGKNHRYKHLTLDSLKYISDNLSVSIQMGRE